MKMLRTTLHTSLSGIPVPIVSGPNRGVRLSLPVCGRHWSGNWESERVALVERLVHAGDVVWDIGAHHGVISLMASRLAGARGTVHAFEPARGNFALLRQHLAWNTPHTVTAHNLAVAARPERRRFGGSGSSQALALDVGDELVDCTTIESLIASGIPAPTVIKLDAEGSEGEILETSMAGIPANCRLLVSIHSQDNYRKVVERLMTFGFRVLESTELRQWVQRGAVRWTRDPDLLAIGPAADDCFAGFRSLRTFC
jgi:FkbM family methyltransferase